MIDSETAKRIREVALTYWRKEVTTPDFVQQASGKEIGHRIADAVEEKTTALLEQHFTTARQRNAQGRVVDRSMGDIWIFSEGIYNPVNVKAGEANQNGQPNIVSLRKLLRAVLLRQIDSYYVLIVKVLIERERISVNDVYFADVLDHLDYVAFDSGPGQMMLKERAFYTMMDHGPTPTRLSFGEGSAALQLSLDQKIQLLFGLLDDADRRLMENRARVRETINELRRTYEANKDRPIDQTRLNLR